MTPSTPTRRRTLIAAAGTLAALAGCSGTDRGGGRGTPTAVGRRRPFDPDAVPAHRRLRAPTDDPLVWEPTPTTDADADDDDPRRRRPTFVASRETAERIELADVDGAADARSFLAETAFDAETVYVERYPVRACYALQLCAVSWSATRVDTQFGRVLRDADVACATDARESTAWLIRIPEALDVDRITSYSSGSGSGSCAEGDRPDRDRPLTADAVPAPNATATATDTATDAATGGDDA
ncbi:hypothetical protein [Halobaculum lipolyticum]|uniref:Uncharacterized protein n=1 Tax=Halobaculum lipolyticum TaxID=3032001 RepID=A0ABD5WB89_9EURY|nr:hypothetical protein [Halobaculum sp. DT31]